MNSKLTFTPAQIKKFKQAYAATRNTDWRIHSNSVTTIQAFRTLMGAFPGLLRDWNGAYATTKRSNGRKSSTSARRGGKTANALNKNTGTGTKTRSSSSSRNSTTSRSKASSGKRAQRWNANSKSSASRTNANRWNGKRNTSTRSSTWNKRGTNSTKSRRAA